MSPSIFVQFDRAISDTDRLLADLRAAGIPARSTAASRWVVGHAATLVESDAGPRLDIEIMLQARAAARPLIASLELFIRTYAG